MQSHISEIDPVHVEVHVEVPWERVSKELSSSFKKLQKSAQVRGFRKGKAPQQVIRQLYGKQVSVDVASQLVEETLMAAIAEHSLPLVATPQLSELPTPKKGEPLAFSATVEVRPKIESIDLEGLRVLRPSAEVKEEAIDQEIEQIRRRHAVVQEPESARPAKEGDLLTVDYTVDIDGEPSDDLATEDRVLELDDESRLIPALRDGLLGMEIGQTKGIDVVYDEDSPNAQMRGKTATFHVTLKLIKERILPDLDDELAKDADHESLDEMRASIRARLEKEANERAERGMRDQVVDRLVEKNPIPVPPSMREEQEKSMSRDFQFYMQMTGQDPTLDPESKRQIRARSEHQVRAALLLNAIAKQDGIEVSPEEIDEKLKEIAESTGKHPAKVRAEHRGEKLESLESELLQKKLLDHLLSKALVEDAPVNNEDGTGSEGSADAAADDRGSDE